MTFRIFVVVGTSFILCSCEPIVRFESKGLSLQPKSTNDKIIIYNEKDDVPDNAIVLGEIHIDDSGFTTNCNYNYVLECAIQKARQIGADAIKITEVLPPDILFSSSCYRIKAKALHFETTTYDTWKNALQQNNLQAYSEFVSRHPESLFAPLANARIIDMEIASVLRENDYVMLPELQRVKIVDFEEKYTILNIDNGTDYKITLMFSGNDPFKVVFAPLEKGSVQILRGSYVMAVTSDSPSVRKCIIRQSFKGSGYVATFHMASPNTISIDDSLLSYYTQQIKLAPWPCKRKL